MVNRGIRIVAAIALATLAPLAAAQTYPVKPVRIMVGANAGGGTDIIARMLADKYQAAFGQPFVVENNRARPTPSPPTSPRKPRPMATRCSSPPTPARRSRRISSSSRSTRTRTSFPLH
jgi:hypothetical protein